MLASCCNHHHRHNHLYPHVHQKQKQHWQRPRSGRCGLDKVLSLTLSGTCLVLILATAAASNQNQNGAPNSKSAQEQQQTSAVDDILKDTILLLDVLDQKLASVGNKTPNALMQDNLRALDGADGDEEAVAPSPLEGAAASAGDDEALLRLAAGFSPGRTRSLQVGQQGGGRPEEPMAAAASELPDGPINHHHQQQHLRSGLAQDGYSAVSELPAAIGGANSKSKQARQLSQQQLLHDAAFQSSAETLLTASDSNERHIKFTLDLMQAIFSSQSYSSKTNLIESFLISPLSIQMVLMMMHLGARGQTRREIGNCLHLTQPSLGAAEQLAGAPKQLADPANSGPSEHAGPKLKRRQQQAGSASEKSVSSSKLAITNLRQQTSTSAPTIATVAATAANANANQAHELFGAALRNLLKDQIVTKALTSANQIFLQKNLPLASSYEWAIKHFYSADVKLVDFHHQQQQQQHQNAGKPVALIASSDSQSGASNSTTTSYAQSSTANNTSAVASGEQQQQLKQAKEDTNWPNGGNNNIQQMVNDWVERQTRGKIANFLQSPVSTSTLMMAINVLYFKGDWQYKFDPSDTESDGWFTQTNGKSVRIPMMVNRLPLAFAHDPIMKTSAIELPYKAQRLGLFILLPDEVSGIFNTMQMLNSSSFANLISSMRKPSQAGGDQAGANAINVRIPKFSIESSPRLSQILGQQLGLKSLFMPDIADLSGMFAPIQKLRSAPVGNSTASNGAESTSQQVPLQVGLDELIHKAVLQVDEQGSVAAASSATIVERVGLFNSNYFEADHPFLLFLMDKQTGLVLFSGAFAGNNLAGNSSSAGGNNNNNNNNQQQEQQRH